MCSFLCWKSQKLDFKCNSKSSFLSIKLAYNQSCFSIYFVNPEENHCFEIICLTKLQWHFDYYYFQIWQKPFWSLLHQIEKQFSVQPLVARSGMGRSQDRGFRCQVRNLSTRYSLLVQGTLPICLYVSVNKLRVWYCLSGWIVSLTYTLKHLSNII